MSDYSNWSLIDRISLTQSESHTQSAYNYQSNQTEYNTIHNPSIQAKF